MATTTRLVLYKPVGSDLVDPVVAINNQMNVIDNKACRTLVTLEASPPVAEFPFQEWFTKDTHKFYYADNSLAWQQISLPTSGAPAVGRKSFTTAATSTTSTYSTTEGQENGPQVHSEISVVSGNTYICYASVQMYGGSSITNNKCLLRFRVSSGSSVVTTAGTLFYQCHGDYPDDLAGSAQSDKFVLGRWTATFTGAASFGLFLAKTTGMTGTAKFERTTGTTETFQYMSIEEVSA